MDGAGYPLTRVPRTVHRLAGGYRQGLLAGQVVGHALEADDRVDLLDPDVVGHVDRRRGVVENRGDAGVDQAVDDLLAGGCGDGDDRDANAPLADDARRFREGLDLEIADLLADLKRVVVEEADDLEALGREAVVAGDRVAEAADTA